MLLKKLKYRFDCFMSRGTVVLVALLFLITLLTVVLAGFIAMLIDGTERSLSHSVWQNFMYTLDPGNLSGAQGNAAFLLVALLATLCGLFFTSILIGIINSGIENKMAELRRGKSAVFESGHTVVLGFNETAVLILRQLVLSGENHKRQVVVVMDAKSKDEMENEIRRLIPDRRTTRFVCRSGQPDSLPDLDICSLKTCRSVVLALDDDFASLRALLGITKSLGGENPSAFVTAVVQDERNLHAMRVAGEGRAETICLHRTIARIIAHSCLQPGISAVFTELFNFEGVEIYVEAIPDAQGMRLDRANLRFPHSTLIGLVRDGKPLINPPPWTVIMPNDRLVLIAPDDGTSRLDASEPSVDEEAFAVSGQPPARPVTQLVLGCSPLLMDILTEEDKYLPPGSHVRVVMPAKHSGSCEQAQGLKLSNITLSAASDEIHTRECLERLVDEEVRNVLVLSDRTVSQEESDGAGILLLLMLRDIAKRRSLSFSITTEIQNAENRQLITTESATDFVVSSHITALLIAQVSQTRELASIFRDLLDDSGSEIYIRPASRYVTAGIPVSLATVSMAAAQHGEVLIGYRKGGPNGGSDTPLNLSKAEKVTFAPDDCIVVLAEG